MSCTLPAPFAVFAEAEPTLVELDWPYTTSTSAGADVLSGGRGY
jgi:hypothetical protein